MSALMTIALTLSGVGGISVKTLEPVPPIDAGLTLMPTNMYLCRFGPGMPLRKTLLNDAAVSGEAFKRL